MGEIDDMPWLIALAVVMAAPPEADKTVVLVARRTAVTPALARTLAQDTSKHLAAAGVGIAFEPDAALKRLAQVSVKDTTSCNGKRACLAELGRQLAVPWVVALSAATLDSELSVGLELIRVARRVRAAAFLERAVQVRRGRRLPRRLDLLDRRLLSPRHRRRRAA
jgi:hypothetical protein